ncbi:MAG: hypothetical protein ABIV51_08000 [Saprospiraceae bacterium]
MKLLAISLLCFLLKLSSAYSYDIHSLRQLYYAAAVNKDSANKFQMVMRGLESNTDPIYMCYKGMANLMQANHSINPYTKIACFNKGKAMLEKAISADPKNIEMRFMRYGTQTNAPLFLGYSSNINADKLAIMNGWSTITDNDLKEKIRKYMMESNLCGTKEKLIFK